VSKALRNLGDKHEIKIAKYLTQTAPFQTQGQYVKLFRQLLSAYFVAHATSMDNLRTFDSGTNRTINSQNIGQLRTVALEQFHAATLQQFIHQFYVILNRLELWSYRV
jgi:hypothetical protein